MGLDMMTLIDENQGNSIDIYLHQKYWTSIEDYPQLYVSVCECLIETMVNIILKFLKDLRKIRLVGVRVDGRKHKRLLPTEYMMILLSSRDSDLVQSFERKPSAFVGKVVSIGDVVLCGLEGQMKKVEILLQSVTKMVTWILWDEQIPFGESFEEVGPNFFNWK